VPNTGRKEEKNRSKNCLLIKRGNSPRKGGAKSLPAIEIGKKENFEGPNTVQ